MVALQIKMEEMVEKAAALLSTDISHEFSKKYKMSGDKKRDIDNDAINKDIAVQER